MLSNGICGGDKPIQGGHIVSNELTDPIQVKVKQNGRLNGFP